MELTTLERNKFLLLFFFCLVIFLGVFFLIFFLAFYTFLCFKCLNSGTRISRTRGEKIIEKRAGM